MEEMKCSIKRLRQVRKVAFQGDCKRYKKTTRQGDSEMLFQMARPSEEQGFAAKTPFGDSAVKKWLSGY